jgi:uncharacterized protein (TIGR02300 family)
VANDPTFETELHAGTLTLVKADLGTKRNCPSCGARFYDLQKRPIECPKCAFSFEPEALYKQRRPRQPEPAPAAVVVEREDDEELEEEEEETEDVEAEEAEQVVDEAPLVVGDEEDETVEEEATEQDAGMSVVEGDAENADIEDIEDEDVDDDDEDDGLLEEVEEDEDDVSGIIDTDIGKDEP